VSSTFEQAQRNLAANVKRVRLAAGISQEELAFRAGIDRTYASQIERAIANPSLGITCSIADALGVTAVDLLTKSAISTTPTSSGSRDK
jgi:transcriptional regulator with XRE-family HTH domain